MTKDILIKEISFGTAIKLGKTLELSWHNIRGNRYTVRKEGEIFIFEDSQKEFPTTYTTIANVKYWTEVVPTKEVKKGKE